MDLLELVEDLGTMAALAPTLAPGSREAAIVALGGRVAAQLARALRDARDSGIDINQLRLVAFDDLVAEKAKGRE